MTPVELEALRLTPEVKALLKKGDERARFMCATEGHVFADAHRAEGQGFVCRRCARMEAELLADDELVDILGQWERGWLRAYESDVFKNNPTALPGPTPPQKRRFDALWREADGRGLRERVEKEVRGGA